MFGLHLNNKSSDRDSREFSMVHSITLWSKVRSALISFDPCIGPIVHTSFAYMRAISRRTTFIFYSDSFLRHITFPV